MLILMCAAGFMIALDTTVVATVLTALRRDLGAPADALEWTVNAYVLAFGVLLLTGSALGDRFGRRRMFAIGLAVFTAASAAAALAPGIGALIAARTVQGAGAALILPLAMTQLSAGTPAHRRGRALGLFTGAAGLATFSGPFLGGLIAQTLSWRWVFWLNVPIGVGVIVLVRRVVDESYGARARFDPGGVALATAGLLGLVWGLVRGNSAGWTSPEVLGALLAALVLLAAFVGWESRVEAPVLPLSLLRIRAFSTTNVANVCLIGSMYGALFLLAQYLQVALGYGPMAAGLRLMPWTGLLMVVAPAAGTLADRFGERVFLIGGLSLHVVGLVWLAVAAGPRPAYGQLVVPLLLGGLGLSMALPAAQRAVVGAVPVPRIGQASGVFNSLRQIGGVFGIAVVAAVFAGAGGDGSAVRFAAAFTPAILAAAGLAAVGLLTVAGYGLTARVAK